MKYKKAKIAAAAVLGILIIASIVYLIVLAVIGDGGSSDVTVYDEEYYEEMFEGETMGTVHSTEGDSEDSSDTSEESEDVVTEDEAVDIAFSDAWLSESDVSYIEITTEEGYYVVEFEDENNKEYRYEIDMYTGDILEIFVDESAKK